MATIDELMHANLFEVFGERDPERQAEAIRRTYATDVHFSRTTPSTVTRR